MTIVSLLQNNEKKTKHGNSQRRNIQFVKITGSNLL